MSGAKYSVILSNVGSCCDRFLSSGYSEPLAVAQMFDKLAAIDSVDGVELVSTWHITESNVTKIKEHLQRTGLKLVSIIPDHFGTMKWARGAFSSKDPAIRKDAVTLTKNMMDVAVELGCDLVSLWPGQDGYDYHFQADYAAERTWFEQGVKECCRHRRDVRVAIEYKVKEPRTHSYPSTVYSTLLMVNTIDEPNCGVTIDYGHALVAYENVAESVAVLSKYGDKLYHVHMNDNYGLWDDDMIAGSVNTIGYIEFLYWIKRTGYKGFISMDQYPYREDGQKAVSESILWMKAIERLVDGMDMEYIGKIIERGDATEASAMLRNLLFGKA